MSLHVFSFRLVYDLFSETHFILNAWAYTIEDPPNRIEEDLLTGCIEEPTPDWRRR